jgi:hypothetical protein
MQAHASRDEEIEAAVEEAQKNFEGEVAILRGALDKLKVQITDPYGLNMPVSCCGDERGEPRAQTLNPKPSTFDAPGSCCGDERGEPRS